jgi:hydrophobe/amphiphile efflux-3 (HAE3) family protein
VKRLLGRVSEWAVTHPTQTIAGVIAIVAIVGVIGALRLTPDAGTDKLVDTGSTAFEGTQEFRDRFGDEAIVVLAREDLQQLMLTEDLQQLLKLEACLSGNAPPGDAAFPPVCDEITSLDATRVVFGPATFLNQASTEASTYLREQYTAVQQQSQRAAAQAVRAAQEQGLSEEEQAAAASAAQQQVLGETISQFQDLALSLGAIFPPTLQNPQFIQAIVFDSRLGPGVPKSRFGYLFPSPEGALISTRLEPDLDDETRREAIDLIRQATDDPAFALSDGNYEVSGVPVVVEGLADELGGEIFLLLGVALVVMALTLIAAFGPPLRLLPLFVALGGSAMAFGLLSVIGGSLTMASVAVLPVVIGLGVDYAIQLQARFREAAEAGERPAAAAVIAAVRGGPVIATAALATTVGFLSLVLSPIPMVREFAFALVIGIISALAIALTAGLAALSTAKPAAASSRPEKRRLPGALSGAGESFGTAGARTRALLSGIRARSTAFGRRALATAISAPGRVLGIAAVLAVLGWGVGTQTEVVSDVRELVPTDLPALEGVDELQSVTGVSGEVDVIVRGEDVTTPEALTWMRDFKAQVLSEHGFAGEFPDCRADGTELCPGPALPDLLRSDTEPTQERIDAILDVVPEYFLQAILSRPEGEEQIANISFLIPVMPLDEQKALIDEIRADIDPPEGLTAEVVGLPVLAADANSELSGSRYWLTLLSLFAVAVVLLSVYRSARRALVPLIPIVLATGWSSLVLAAVQIPLNPMSATLGVLVIAVATEFSVILAARYEEEREAGNSIGQALRRTYERTGTAVLASGITSIAGFGVLVVSGITMLRDFGFVTIVDLSVSLAGVMLVLPASLVWAEGGFRPFPALLGKLRPKSRGPKAAAPGASESEPAA